MILRSHLFVVSSFLGLPVWSAESRSSDSGRPRGVGPEFAKFYKSSSEDSTFKCISNPSLRIPYSRVNDDYCDCPDGSDEPGTAACSFLSPLSPHQPRPGAYTALLTPPSNESLALPGFYCKNKGHIPGYIRFESVNDGKCDYDVCCDGSDEFAHVGGIKCEDRCGPIGKEHKANEEKRQKAYNKALKKKKEMQFEADKARTELAEKIEALEIKIQGLERLVADAEENLANTERREKLKIVRTDAAGKSTGKLGMLLNLSKARVEELRFTISKTRKQRNAMVARITELEALLSDLKEGYNPNFNDAGVKKAVQGWEDYAAREDGENDSWTEAEERDVDEIAKADSAESGIHWSEFEFDDSSSENTPESEMATIYHFTAYLPPAIQSWLSETYTALKQILIDNGVLPSSPGAGTASAAVADSPAVQEARKSRDSADRDLSSARNDLSSSRDDLAKDYGPQGIFRSLTDHCVSTESGEYVYSHCFMSKTTQKPKRGGGETNMGNFVGFDTEYVDDVENPVGGKGLGKGMRVVMKYENGQHCWNGPNRSTRVVLACSETEEIWKVSESEKCVYRMEVGTAAVCGVEVGDTPVQADAATEAETP